jgi:hypothetical protein
MHYIQRRFFFSACCVCPFFKSSFVTTAVGAIALQVHREGGGRHRLRDGSSKLSGSNSRLLDYFKGEVTNVGSHKSIYQLRIFDYFRLALLFRELEQFTKQLGLLVRKYNYSSWQPNISYSPLD